ncbi:MAG: hypothetical protein KAV87_61695 [Desulfobacteraceae bacterium]|nr:hypothetical protein [Desulfobacteraceae bacterium]
MVVLMLISAAGFLLSLILHIATLLHVEMELDKVMQVLAYGMFALLLPAVVIAHRLRRSFGNKAFGEALKNACPGWMQTTVGLIIVYAIVNLLIQLVRKGNFAFAYSALLMAAYSVLIAGYYSYNRLKSSDKGHSPKGEN